MRARTEEHDINDNKSQRQTTWQRQVTCQTTTDESRDKHAKENGTTNNMHAGNDKWLKLTWLKKTAQVVSPLRAVFGHACWLAAAPTPRASGKRRTTATATE
jgi:hypothetical protein